MFVNYSAWFWNLSETSFWCLCCCCCCWFNKFDILIFSSSFVRSFPHWSALHWSALHWSNENEIYAQNRNTPIRLAVILCSAVSSIFTCVCVCFVCFFDYSWLDDRLTGLANRLAGALDHLQKPVTTHIYPYYMSTHTFRIALSLVSSIFWLAFSCSVSDFTLINVCTPNLQQAKGYTYFMHKNIVNIRIEISWTVVFFRVSRDNCIPLCRYSI